MRLHRPVIRPFQDLQDVQAIFELLQRLFEGLLQLFLQVHQILLLLLLLLVTLKDLVKRRGPELIMKLLLLMKFLHPPSRGREQRVRFGLGFRK
jgi:hypothetical protein